MNGATHLPIQPGHPVSVPEGTDMNQHNKLAAFEPYRITDSTPIEEPTQVITINGETISTEGNITTLSGDSKSGKSAFTAWLLAGACSPTGLIIDPLDGLTVAPNPMGKAVIHIDTEQALHKHQRNLRAVFKRLGSDYCPQHFLSYNLRKLNIGEYAGVTSGIFEAAEAAFGGVHIVVVDGIADYIPDVNDPIQSNAIVKHFEELAIQYKTPIVVIVHTNPNSGKERGHLGSQCQRKSESVLTVKCEGDISYLEPKLLRMAGKGNIPILAFRYDKEKGYHVQCSEPQGSQLNKDAIRLAEIKKTAEIVFAPPVALQYGTALERIMKHAQKQDRTAKDYFKEMKAHQMIEQGEDGLWRIAQKTND